MKVKQESKDPCIAEYSNMHIRLTLSSQMNVFTREVYNFLDFLGDIGGVNEGVKVLGAFILWLVQLLTPGSFMSAIISEVFYNHMADKEDMWRRFNCGLICLMSKRERREIRIGSDKIDNNLEISKFLTRHRLLWEQFRSQFKTKEEYMQYKIRSATLELEPQLISSVTGSEYDVY